MQQEIITSRFNGIKMAKHPAISAENWGKVKGQLRNTEGARLFDIGKTEIVQAPKASAGATFGVPSGASIEFEADRKKREAKEAAAQSQSERMKARWAEKKAQAAKEESNTVM